MRILLIMDAGLPVPPKLYGGHERLVYLFAEEYHRLGHEVTLLAGPGSHCSGKTVTFGTNDLNRSKTVRLKEAFFVWSYLRTNKHNFDLVHNFGRLIYLLPILNSPIKKIMSYGRKIAPFGIKVFNRLPNKNIVFTACSDYCVNTGNVAGRWETVYNTINFADYSPSAVVDDDAPLVFLSRLDKIKGPHIAIDIALKSRHKLIIAGNEPTTPDNIEYYNKLVRPLVDQQQIVYIGPVNDVQKNNVLAKCKAMLFPLSGDEAFGLVMIEAMACGTPVIAFRHAAAPEVIDEGVSGFIVDNEAGMLNAVAKISQIDRIKCREIAEKRFDVKVVAAHYLSLFND
jgi:glycosyltransferase involved in cell wall biosynthesis